MVNITTPMMATTPTAKSMDITTVALLCVGDWLPEGDGFVVASKSLGLGAAVDVAEGAKVAVTEGDMETAGEVEGNDEGEGEGEGEVDGVAYGEGDTEGDGFWEGAGVGEISPGW
jgi:hypothetical protein